MRDWLIKKLGGYTRHELEQARISVSAEYRKAMQEDGAIERITVDGSYMWQPIPPETVDWGKVVKPKIGRPKGSKNKPKV